MRETHSEEVEIIQSAVLLVGAAQSNHDNAYQRRDGEYIGGKYAQKTATFAHDGGFKTITGIGKRGKK